MQLKKHHIRKSPTFNPEVRAEHQVNAIRRQLSDYSQNPAPIPAPKLKAQGQLRLTPRESFALNAARVCDGEMPTRAEYNDAVRSGTLCGQVLPNPLGTNF